MSSMYKETKHIVFFDFANLGYGGGCEKNFMKLGAWLANRGHQISFLTPSPLLNSRLSHIPGISAYPENISRESIIKEFGVTDYQYIRGRDLLQYSGRRRLREFMNSADIIISKNEIFEIVLLKLIRVDFKKIVFGFHTPLYYPTSISFKSRFHNILYHSNFYRYLLQHSRVRCLVLTSEDKTFLESGASAIDVTVIPNPLDTAKFSLKFYQKQVSFNVYYIGRLTEQKGIDVLAEAIKLLSNKDYFHHMSFNFVGAGEKIDIVLKLSQMYKNCNSLGFMNEVVDCYKVSDLVVVPSRWESFCYTVAEAQSSGVPVIVSDIPGPRDIAVDEKTGWFVKSGDAVVLANAIEKAYLLWRDDFESYTRMGKLGRDNVVSKFHEDIINEKIESFLINNGPSKSAT